MVKKHFYTQNEIDMQAWVWNCNQNHNYIDFHFVINSLSNQNKHEISYKSYIFQFFTNELFPNEVFPWHFPHYEPFQTNKVSNAFFLSSDFWTSWTLIASLCLFVCLSLYQLVCGGLMKICTLALILIKFCLDIPTCPRKVLVQFWPRPETLKSEGNIFEKCLRNKRC